MATGQQQPWRVEWRVEQLERQIAEYIASNKTLDMALTNLKEAVTALDARIKVHDESRKFWGKIWLAVATAVALGLVGFLLKISYIVQSSRLP